MNTMNTIPTIAMDMIMSTLALKDLGRLACTSKTNRDNADSDAMWFPQLMLALRKDFRTSRVAFTLKIGETSVHVPSRTDSWCTRQAKRGKRCTDAAHYELDSLVYVSNDDDAPSMKKRCGLVYYNSLNNTLPGSTVSLEKAIDARDAAIEKVTAIHKRKRLESVFNAVTGNDERKKAELAAKLAAKKARLEKKKAKLEERGKHIAAELARIDEDLTN